MIPKIYSLTNKFRLFHAAKALEQAVLVCKELGDIREIQKLADRACNLYQSHGSADAGASVLEKAAKIVESQDAAIALQLYQHALDVVTVITSPFPVRAKTIVLCENFLKFRTHVKHTLSFYFDYTSPHRALHIVCSAQVGETCTLLVLRVRCVFLCVICRIE